MTKEIALKWYKQACHDCEMAEKNIGIGGYDVSAFLSHQSVEKLLKAAFAYQGRKIPRIHYVDELATQLNLDQTLIDKILDLTVDYTFARYPDVGSHIPFEEYTEDIAREKVECAKYVFKEIEKLFPDIGDEDV